jgi:hypothetical protein
MEDAIAHLQTQCDELAKRHTAALDQLEALQARALPKSERLEETGSLVCLLYCLS